MNIRFRCRCFQSHRVPLPPPENPFRCHVCRKKWPLAVTPSVAEKNVLDACPVCGVSEFYLARDFPPLLGVIVVGAGSLAAFVLGLRYGFWPLFLSLAALAAADFILYKRLSNVTRCYVCKSEFRGFHENPSHRGFNLEHLDVVEARYKSVMDSLKPPPDDSLTA